MIKNAEKSGSEVVLRNSATVNPCKLCAPLGASLALKGFNKGMSILHGSQGCATYIRRYLISHFREPVDIASSSFDENTAVFGGKDNLFASIQNVCSQYNPEIIGIATTCLSETIGDDVSRYIKEYQDLYPDSPFLVPISTPSYSGTHMDGFRKAVKAVVAAFAKKHKSVNSINLFPSIISPAEIRHLREITESFNIDCSIFPDYSQSLDGGMWAEYLPIAPGGSSIPELESCSGAIASIEFSGSNNTEDSGGSYLKEEFKTPLNNLCLPIGIGNCDSFFDLLSELSGNEIPDKYFKERSRLLDAYADGHKYLFGKKIAIYGEIDTVLALTGFSKDLGMDPVICMTGEKSASFTEDILKVYPEAKDKNVKIESGADFLHLEETVEKIKPELLIGSSKGAKIARKMNIPLIRTGFPIHDRFGGPSQMYLAYKGTHNLLITIINAFLEKRQNESTVVYTYL